jgi:hypothetical protein
MNEPMKLEIVRLAGDGSNWVSYRDRMGIILRMRRFFFFLRHAQFSITMKAFGVDG